MRAALLKAEGSHMGSDGTGTAERGACQGSPGGRRRGQKSERGRHEEGKREQRVHGSPPVVLLAFAPGSVSPRGAAGCSHAETPAFLSPPRLLPAQGLPTRANLQHMGPSSPAPPTHTHTIIPLTPLSPHPGAEGVGFPQAITKVTKFVFASSSKCLRAVPPLFFFLFSFFNSHLEKQKCVENNPPIASVSFWAEGKTCRSALSQGKLGGVCANAAFLESVRWRKSELFLTGHHCLAF